MCNSSPSWATNMMFQLMQRSMPCFCSSSSANNYSLRAGKHTVQIRWCSCSHRYSKFLSSIFLTDCWTSQFVNMVERWTWSHSPWSQRQWQWQLPCGPMLWCHQRRQQCRDTWWPPIERKARSPGTKLPTIQSCCSQLFYLQFTSMFITTTIRKYIRLRKTWVTTFKFPSVTRNIRRPTSVSITGLFEVNFAADLQSVIGEDTPTTGIARMIDTTCHSADSVCQPLRICLHYMQ